MAPMRGSHRVLLVAAILLGIVASQGSAKPVVRMPTGPRGISSQQAARGTFNLRDFAGNGHCSFGQAKALDLEWRKGVVSVGIPSTLYNSSYLCGLCIAFKARTKRNPFKTTGWQYGIVADDCPRCKKDEMVVYGKGSGWHPIWWQPIQCNTRTAPIQYAFQGGNDFYFKVAISNTRVPVKSVWVRVGKGAKARYDVLVRKSDNYWEYNPMGRKIQFPITIRVQSYLGDTVEEVLPIKQPVGVVKGKKQFPFHKNYISVP